MHNHKTDLFGNMPAAQVTVEMLQGFYETLEGDSLKSGFKPMEHNQ